jgi:GTP cyclohydrolase II
MLPEIPQSICQRQMSLISTCKIKVDDIKDECTLSVYRRSTDSQDKPLSDLEVVALVRGDLASPRTTDVPVRIHSECFTGDIIGSMRCDCGHQLRSFMREVMNENSPSILIYVRGHEGRGIGLANKVKCYQVQDEEKLDTVDANIRLGFNVDMRTFEECWEVLKMLNVGPIDLYTNNPGKIPPHSANVRRVVPLASVPNGVNNNYLMTKQVRLKHKTCIDTMRWDELLHSEMTPVSPEHTVTAAPILVSRPHRVCIVAAKWNDEYVSGMVDACVSELEKVVGVDVTRVQVPGAFDLVTGAKKVATRNFDSIICIGVLIKGETDMYQHSCSAISNALAHLNTLPGIPPIVNGLQMFNSEAQANERLNDESSNKLGISWAKTALSVMDL